MNPTLKIWVQLIGLLALEVAVIVGIAAQLQRWAKHAVWRRTIWQACTLGLLMLVVSELTGVGRGIFAWTGRNEITANPVLARVMHDNTHRSTRLERPTVQPRANSRTAPAASTLRQTEPSAPGDSMVRAAPQIRPKKWTDLPAVSESVPLIWLGTIWMTGATIVIGRVLVSRVILEVLRWKHGEMDDADLKHVVKELAERMGIRRRICLMESAHISSPVAFGIIRPTIGLPVHFSEKFNSNQQGAMLAHELAHLAGNDPAWYLLADILAALLWWHPLVWWARRQLQAQSEQAADDASLLVTDGPGVLAECLVALGAQLARTRSFIPLPLGVAGSGFRSGLGQRVERLVKLEGTAWHPPNRLRCGLARIVGPVALVSAAILCTAWVVPPALNKGENMQTMKQTWKKSLAALALLTALSPDGNRALAEPTEPPTAFRAGVDDQFVPLNNSQSQPGQPGLAGPRTSLAQQSADKEYADFVADFNRPTMSKEQRAIEAKLSDLRLGEVKYDGLPLVEVVNNLIETAAKHFPDGLNFVLNREPASAPGAPAAIDPATGLPVPQSAESADLSSVTIHINPPLKNIRMIDLLDAITKTSDQPIHYTIEDYGVLFSLGAKPKEELRRASFQDRLSKVVKSVSEPKPASPALEVMTFKVDTNTFFTGMERTFGVTLQSNDPARMTTSEIKRTIEIFFEKLKIDMSVPGKSIFYNDVNGMLMVCGTRQDLALVTAAIQTLGGVPNPSPRAQWDVREYGRAVRDASRVGGGFGGGSTGGQGRAVALPDGK